MSKGLTVNPKYPFLGASVDSIVSCSKCGVGVVEIKCPYKWRHASLSSAVKDNNFCCVYEDGQLKLKSSHNYMYQVIGQMAILELEWADFVVWTKKDCRDERIYFNENVWNVMLEKMLAFYTYGVAAELLSERVRRGKTLYLTTTSNVDHNTESAESLTSDEDSITSDIVEKSLKVQMLFENSDDAESSFYGF